MTPRRMALAAALVLTVVFLSPIAYLAGQRAGVWLSTPAAERSGPWPSVDEGERESAAPAERAKPQVRPASARSSPAERALPRSARSQSVTTSPSYAHSSGTEAACASISRLMWVRISRFAPTRPACAVMSG